VRRVRIKFCGMTRAEDVAAAAAAGADAIGLVLHGASRRVLELEQAGALAAAAPAFVARVAVLVDPDAELVRRLLALARVDLLQFHGSEPPALCRSFGLPYVKAVGMEAGADLAAAARRYPDAAALLADTRDPVHHGGTGRRFDWSTVPASLPLPLVLAGGLTPANVAAAIRQVRPYAVDVSSGVETSPGIKDAALIHAFAREVHREVHALDAE